MFRAPLPNLLVHIHAAAFTLWIVLLLTQISLVTERRVDLHRRLGQLGFALAVLMIVLGVLTASDRLTRQSANPGAFSIEEVRHLYAVSMGDILMFGSFVYFGYRNRFRSAGAQAAHAVRHVLAIGCGLRSLAGVRSLPAAAREPDLLCAAGSADDRL